ncbi:MAG: hypothetical protein V3S00_01110, partial [Dehalococcoidia bacterium]
MRKLVAPAALAFAALLAAACSGGDGASAPTPTLTSTPTLTATPTPSPEPTASPTPTPIPTPTPEPTPTPTAEEILRRSSEAMIEVKPEVERDRMVDRATNVKIEREEGYEGQPVWVISYEVWFRPFDSNISAWFMEWIAKDSYLVLRHEGFIWDSMGPPQGWAFSVFSDPSGESEGAGINIVSTDGLLLNGTVSGVRVFNTITWEEAGSPPQKDCDREFANPQPVPHADTVGTPLNITPTYLPARAIESPRDVSDLRDPPAVICGGQVSRAKRVYRVPFGPDELEGTFEGTGGWIPRMGWIIIEKWRGPNLYVGDMLAEYVSAG